VLGNTRNQHVKP